MTDGLVIIVGAGPGIGLATARRFGSAGHTVALIARNEEKLRTHCAELESSGVRALYRAADCADAAALAAALADIQGEAGVPTVLLYNAANLKWKNLLDESAAELTADFRINVAGALTSVQGVLPAMRAAKTGTILLTGSVFASEPLPAFGSLSIGKAALRNLAGSLAQALRDSGIRVRYLNIRGRVTADDPVRSPDAIAELCWQLHAGTVHPDDVEVPL